MDKGGRELEDGVVGCWGSWRMVLSIVECPGLVGPWVGLIFLSLGI